MSTWSLELKCAQALERIATAMERQADMMERAEERDKLMDESAPFIDPSLLLETRRNALAQLLEARREAKTEARSTTLEDRE